MTMAYVREQSTVHGRGGGMQNTTASKAAMGEKMCCLFMCADLSGGLGVFL